MRRKYHIAFIENVDWGELQEKKPVEDRTKKDDGLVKNRNIAAVGRLLALMSESMPECVKTNARGTTICCHNCGSRESFDSATTIVYQCGCCGEVWDRDYNAAVNLLNRGLAMECVTA
jgi:hypothetical protein